MILSIPDMSCGHCKAAVERAIIDLDSSADVVVDVDAKTARVVTLQPTEAVLHALAEVGYPATVAG